MGKRVQNSVVWVFNPSSVTPVPDEDEAVLTQVIDEKDYALRVAMDAEGYFTNPAQIDILQTPSVANDGPWKLFVSDGHFPDAWKTTGHFQALPSEEYYPVEVEFEPGLPANIEVAQRAKVAVQGSMVPSVATVISLERGVRRRDKAPVFAVTPNGLAVPGEKPVVYITERQFTDAGLNGNGVISTSVAISYYTHPFPWDKNPPVTVTEDYQDGTFEILVWNHRTGKRVPVNISPRDWTQCAGVSKPEPGANNITDWKPGASGVLALSESFLRGNGLWPPAPRSATADPKTPQVDGVDVD